MTAALQPALAALHAGGLILYPTDTVWGIGCDATNEQAVAKIFALKQRADHQSLVLLADDLDMVGRYVRHIPAIACTLTAIADTPLTIVYPQACCLPANVTAPDGSVAFRLVQHDFCRALLRQFRKPLVSTSANLSGHPAPAAFGEIADVIRRGCDFVTPEACEGRPSRKPSAILKIGLNAEVTVIRQ